MMRRRRNQPYAGHGKAHLGDAFTDFATGKLAALAGLGTLRHFDFDLFRLHQILRRDTKSPGSDLLHRAFALSAETLDLFSALARTGFAADAVHGDGQRLVRL